MRTAISRWFLFGLLIGWSVTHASVFGQATTPGGTRSSVAQPAGGPATPVQGASIEKVKQGLDKSITVDFTGQSIEEILNHVRDKSGVPISIDDQSLGIVGMNFMRPDGQPMQFQIKATNEKTGQVLRKFLNNYRLSYVLFENSVLVTTEEMAIVRQMKQRVSINLEEVPANKAIRDLAKNHGINLVIDPNQAKQAESRVSLQLENTGIETAIRLLAELAELKAVRMGNVMFVTSEARAKKIRDEEGHQFDNPLNPNIPGINNPPVIGFGGGFGGAMPFNRVAPGIAVPANPGPPAVDLPIRPDGVPPPPPKRDPGDEPVRKNVNPVPPDQPARPPVIERPAPDRPPVRPIDPTEKKS
jgi:hypothetical protein